MKFFRIEFELDMDTFEKEYAYGIRLEVIFLCMIFTLFLV